MFPRAYFAGRHFAPRFFPGGAGEAVDSSPFVVCVRGADRRVVAVTGSDSDCANRAGG